MSRERRPDRGVRLSDLDRTKVYRIGYVGRRWEVLGPEDAADEGGGPGTYDDARAVAERRAGSAYVPRHAAPAASPG